MAPQERKKKTQRRAPNQHKIPESGTFLGGQSGWPLANSCEVRVSSEERYSNITAAAAERFKWSQYVENSDTIKRNRGPIKYRKVDIPLMIGPVSLQCKDGLKSFGGVPRQSDGVVDGAKKTCGLTGENNCVIFSIGSFNEWAFEEAIFNGTNCTIHTFDCTLGTGGTSYLAQTGGVQVPRALSSRVFGHNFCLGAKDEKIGGNEFRTWESLLQIAKVTQSPTYVKMDIEGE